MKDMAGRKIRLGVDARILSQPMNGAARCVIALLKGLHLESQFEVYLFTDTPLREEYKQYLFDYRLVALGNKRLKRYWKNWILPLYLLKYKIDLYHATWDKGTPIFALCPRVMTIYDLYCICKNNTYLNKRKKISRFISLYLEISVCKKIFTISENTKKEIMGNFRVAAEKISLIYLDCDRPYIKNLIAVKNSPASYYKQLSRSEYFMSIVGRLDDARKNIPFLVKAFHKFIEKNRALNSKYKLLLAGGYKKNNESYKKLIELIASCRLRENIIITGYLKDEILYNLLSSSKIMIFTSLFEGFGIPLLEAFFLGIPVIASESSAIPEVADRNSALLINPASEEELSSAVSSICNDDNLRKRLIDNGFKRLNDFNWQKTMNKILMVYKELS